MTGEQLRQAAHDGDSAKVSALLSTQGAQSFINYQDEHGCTPLFHAAKSGHEAVTKKLLAARCNVDLQSKMRATPLHMAAGYGHATITKQLLEARCNVDLKSPEWGTALQEAERLGYAGIAMLIRNRKQETPLLGGRVVINGLVAKPELNGHTGTAVSFDNDKGRYSVELDNFFEEMHIDTSSSFMIKPCNLSPTVCSTTHQATVAFFHLCRH
jgi:hypothetical protein